MKHVIRTLLLLVFTLWTLPSLAAVTASLDRDRVGPGESVQLTLQHDGRSNSEPDLTPLKRDFDILGRSSGSSIQIVNGRVSSQNQLTLVLSPKRSGNVVVPPLNWGGESTPALSLTVAAGGGGSGQAPASVDVPAGRSGHVFITATLDQKQPYVQAPATLTVRLYTDQPLYQASLSFDPGDDVQVQQLGKDQQTEASRDGHDYKVIERRYLLFPQRSGPLRLNGPVLDAQVPDGRADDLFGNDPFFKRMLGNIPMAGMVGGVKPIRVRAESITLDVRPRPSAAAGHDWLPARKLTLEESWQPDSGAIHVGDPITRHLHLSALGLTAAQLPDLSRTMPVPDGMRAYPDQAKLDDGSQGDSVVGSRDQDIALIASRAGHFEIPAMRVYWWDTADNALRQADLPARSVDVLPATSTFQTATTPAGPSPPPPAATASAADHPGPVTTGGAFPWPWVSLGLAVLWLATVIGWLLWARRRPRMAPAGSGKPAPAGIPSPSEAAARKAFREACRAGDPAGARRGLLRWAASTWPDDPPLGLKQLGARLDDPGLRGLLTELDRACYANGEWNGQQALERLTRLSAKPERVETGRSELAPLYP